MKRIITVIPALLMFAGAKAEDKAATVFDRDFMVDAFHIGATIFLLYLCFNFILQLLQRSLDQRVKMKSLEAGASESMVTRLLKRKGNDMRRNVLLWLCVLLALGAGLAIVNATLPFGIHSMSILACSAGAGLLIFYIVSGRRGNSEGSSNS